MKTVLIFAGGKPIPIHVIGDLPSPDVVIAADSGYSVADSLGFTVDTLVGDMDSFTGHESLPASTSVVKHPRDKDATDLELALELATREEPFRIVLVGAEGGRFDHEVDAAVTLASPRWDATPEIDWIRSDSIVHVIRGTRRLQGDPGSLLSLIAMGGDAVDVSTRGLEWELDRETLYAGSSRGMSNRFVGTEAVIKVGRGTLLGVAPDLPEA